MLRGCSESFGEIVCHDPVGTTTSLLKAANTARCDDDRRAMQRVLNDFLPRPLSGGNRPLGCTKEGFFAFKPASSVKPESCQEVANLINTAVLLFKTGDYRDCKFTTATSTGTTTGISTATSTVTTIPTCYGVPDKQECSELSLADCKSDDKELGYSVVLQCPALCRACNTTSTTTTTTTLLCNGEPDPDECGGALNGRCNRILFNVDVNARCPAMCRACPVVPSEPSSDYSYRLMFVPVDTVEATVDISAEAFETAVLKMLAMLRYSPTDVSVHIVEVQSPTRVDVELWFSSEALMTSLQLFVDGEQLNVKVDSSEYKGYPYTPNDLVVEPACVMFNSHKYLIFSDEVCANAAAKMIQLAAHCPTPDGATTGLSCWHISGGQSLLAAQTAEDCSAAAESASAAIGSYGLEVEIRCEDKFFVVESDCLSSSRSLQRTLEDVSTSAPFGGACDIGSTSLTTPYDTPALIEFYIVADDELRAVASETGQAAVVALQMEVSLASQISMLKPRISVEDIDLTSGRVLVAIAPAPSADVEMTSSIARKLSALITGTGFEFLYRNHRLTTKRKSSTTALTSFAASAESAERDSNNESSLSSSAVALLVLFILLLVLILVVALVLYLQHRGKHAPPEVAVNSLPLSSIASTAHSPPPPPEPNATMVTLSREGEPGYGFGLANVKGKTIISRVTPGSVAQGKLAASDEIVTVNGVSAAEMTKHDFMIALKSGTTIQLGVRKGSIARSSPADGAGVAGSSSPPRAHRPSQQQVKSLVRYEPPTAAIGAPSQSDEPEERTDDKDDLASNGQDLSLRTLPAITTSAARVDPEVAETTSGAVPLTKTLSTTSLNSLIARVTANGLRNAVAHASVVEALEQEDDSNEAMGVVLRNTSNHPSSQPASSTSGENIVKSAAIPVNVSIARPDMSSGFGFGLQWTPDGAEISAVPPDGISAGKLCVGDTVVSINGVDVQRVGPDDLIAIVASSLKVELGVSRKADAKFHQIATLSRPDKSSGFGFGVKWESDGARVAAVASGGIAEGWLVVGDRIVSLNKHRMTDLPQESITAIIATNTTVEVGVERDWSGVESIVQVALSETAEHIAAGRIDATTYGTVQERLTRLASPASSKVAQKTEVQHSEVVESTTRVRRQSWYDAEQRATVKQFAEDTARLKQKQAAAERDAQARLAKLESELTSTKAQLQRQHEDEAIQRKFAEDGELRAKADQAAVQKESTQNWQAQFEARRRNVASAANHRA